MYIIMFETKDTEKSFLF